MTVIPGTLVRLREGCKFWKEHPGRFGWKHVAAGTVVVVASERKRACWRSGGCTDGLFLTNLPGTDYYYFLSTNGSSYIALSPLEQLAKAFGEENEAIATDQRTK